MSTPLPVFPTLAVYYSPTTPFVTPSWVNITNYVRSFTTQVGRQHTLDRVDAGELVLQLDNRDGTFYPWNTNSSLYNSGSGLVSMNPVKITATWMSTTYPIFFGYVSAVEPSLADALSSDCQLTCYDVFNLLANTYLAGSNYASQIESDGGANLVAYFRLGDAVQSFTCADSSGNGSSATLIAGLGGPPAFGVAGVLLYDSNGALDLTNSTSSPNGGFSMNGNPLYASSAWTIEMWMDFAGSSTPTPAFGSATNVASEVLAQWSVGSTIWQLQVGYVGTGSTATFNAFFLVPSLGAVVILGTATPFDGNWHHVALTLSSGMVTLYVDGVSLGSASESMSNPTAFCFGCPNPLYNGFAGSADNTVAVGFAGTVDEVAVYSVALTSTQIATHYEIGYWFRLVDPRDATGGQSPPLTRIEKVLDVAGFPLASIVFRPSGYTYLTALCPDPSAGGGNDSEIGGASSGTAASGSGVTTTTALDYLQILAETEPGIVFGGPDGNVYSYNREYQYMVSAATTSNGIFGDTPSASYYFNPQSFSPRSDDQDVYTIFQVQSARTSSNGTAAPLQQISVASAITQFGQRTLQGLTQLLQQYDIDANAMASNYAIWYSKQRVRFDSIQLDSKSQGGGNFVQMLGRGIFDRITIEYQGQTAASQYTGDHLIESIAHEVNLDPGEWRTTWALSPYEIVMDPWIFGASGQDAFGGSQVLTL